MKVFLKYILALAVISVSFTGQSQENKIKSIEDEYEEFAYVETSKVLLRVAENGYRTPEMLKKLANSFYFQNKMEEAARWYGELFKLEEEVDSEYYFRYALALKGIQNYEESDKWMQKFNEKNPNDTRAKSFIARRDYRIKIEENSKNYVVVNNLDFNSELSDFGAGVYNGTLVFASSRDRKERTYQWNGQPFLDLYSVEINNDGSYGEVTNFNSKINTKLHESSVAFMPDGNTVFFTRNNYFKNKKGKGDEGVIRLKLYRATKNDDGKWDDVTPVHFNSDNYSVAHPSINKEGNRLYFASDMDGTVGDSDIFVTTINEDGTLGTPKNLGVGINTEGPDSFPFISSVGDLYYSTKGIPGLGGYDIFVVRDADNKISNNDLTSFKVTNIGKPFNSNADDFAFYEDVESEKGFFTSNREGGAGDDDIYSYDKGECSQLVSGLVKDARTDEILAGATVILKDTNGNEIERTVTGNDAYYSFEVDCDMQYLVMGMQDNYTPSEKRFDAFGRGEIKIDLLLEPEKIIISPCDDLAKSLDIPTIYFELDKYDIKYAAELELQKLIAIMTDYPTMTVDIRSHTDCRESDSYNITLSQNRAKATYNYLVNNGIDSNRLTYKGYGETRLVNDCGCDRVDTTNCTEEQHQANRRSEFIISSIKGEKCDE